MLKIFIFLEIFPIFIPVSYTTMFHIKNKQTKNRKLEQGCEASWQSPGPDTKTQGGLSRWLTGAVGAELHTGRLSK